LSTLRFPVFTASTKSSNFCFSSVSFFN
jgi:hypothetical protein